MVHLKKTGFLVGLMYKINPEDYKITVFFFFSGRNVDSVRIKIQTDLGGRAVSWG